MSIARLLMIAVLPKGAALMKAPFQSGGVGAGSGGETEASTNRDRKELFRGSISGVRASSAAVCVRMSGFRFASCYYSALLLLLGASAGVAVKERGVFLRGEGGWVERSILHLQEFHGPLEVLVDVEVAHHDLRAPR